MPDDLDRLKAALSARYALERELGRGGMATVYLARDLKHDRSVAVKVLRPELAAAVGPERFLREIEIAARLTRARAESELRRRASLIQPAARGHGSDRRCARRDSTCGASRTDFARAEGVAYWSFGLAYEQKGLYPRAVAALEKAASNVAAAGALDRPPTTLPLCVAAQCRRAVRHQFGGSGCDAAE